MMFVIHRTNIFSEHCSPQSNVCFSWNLPEQDKQTICQKKLCKICAHILKHSLKTSLICIDKSLWQWKWEDVTLGAPQLVQKYLKNEGRAHHTPWNAQPSGGGQRGSFAVHLHQGGQDVHQVCHRAWGCLSTTIAFNCYYFALSSKQRGSWKAPP